MTKESLKDLQKLQVKQLIDNIVHQDIEMSYFECVLGLPARTLTRWKNGDFSEASIALLRIVNTFPWLLGVAEGHFHELESQQRLVLASFENMYARIIRLEEERS